MKTKDYFQSTTFFYNNLFLKKVLEYDLTIEEFILLNYFINMHENFLDIDKVKNYTSLHSDSILKAYNGLITKSVINVVTTKNEHGLIDEIISFDKFISDIDEDLSNSEDRISQAKLIKKFEELSNKGISENEKEMIDAWIQSGNSLEDISKAFDEAKYNGVFNIRFIDKFLSEKDSSIKESGNNEKLFDYDWLSEE